MSTPPDTHSALRIDPVSLEHADVGYLTARVQRLYIELYGGPDDDPLDPAEFRPPRGGVHVAYLDGRPVASGAWRRTAHPALGAELSAELKRMYVVEEAQRRGIARRMHARLEAEIAAAGIEVVILNTGNRQPAAIAFYERCGYVPVPAFGHHICSQLGRFLGKRLRPSD